jgi:hypothetical protein
VGEKRVGRNRQQDRAATTLWGLNYDADCGAMKKPAKRYQALLAWQLQQGLSFEVLSEGTL